MDIERGTRLIKSDSQPYYREFRHVEWRKQTFTEFEWPIQILQTAHQLAMAGFFYTGYGDATICYCCGNGLKKWQVTDDPYEEHAKHFPDCRHLREMKRKPYIEKVQENKKKNRLQRFFPAIFQRQQIVSTSPECIVCTSTERQVLFQPCRHVAICISCSQNLNKCCICRTEIEEKIRIFAP